MRRTMCYVNSRLLNENEHEKWWVESISIIEDEIVKIGFFSFAEYIIIIFITFASAQRIKWKLWISLNATHINKPTRCNFNDFALQFTWIFGLFPLGLHLHGMRYHFYGSSIFTTSTKQKWSGKLISNANFFLDDFVYTFGATWKENRVVKF